MSRGRRAVAVATVVTSVALILGVPAASDARQSAPPEARFSYYVGEKALAAGDAGKPEFTVLEKLPPAPETRFNYYVPDKAHVDAGKPAYEQLDPHWVIPEKRFEYLMKSFKKFDVDTTAVRTPTTYPEVRFKYFVGAKAVPK